MDVETRLKEIVADIFKVDASQLKDSTRFVEDLKAKSINMIALIAAIEGEFRIKTSALETSKNKTIGQAAEYIEKKLGERKESSS